MTTFARLRVWLLLPILFSAPPVRAGVIYVDPSSTGRTHGDSWATAKHAITDALVMANPGDEIWVAKGFYEEALALPPGVKLYGGFAGNETEREQRDPATNETRLNTLAHVLRVLPGAGRDTVIDGLTIGTGGKGHFYYNSGYGGGIFSDHASPTIRNNRIAYGGAWYGGGIAIVGGSPLIIHNTFENNSAARGGGTIYCEDSAPVVTDNTFMETGDLTIIGSQFLFERNTVVGGAAMHATGSTLTVRHNTFRGVAPDYRGGTSAMPVAPAVVAVSDAGSSAEVTHNSFHDNILDGVQCLDGAVARVANNVFATSGSAAVVVKRGVCTIVNNTVAQNSSLKGTLTFLFADGSVAANNIVAFNVSGIASDGSAALRHNNTFANERFNYANIPDPTGTNGNLMADPRFANPAVGNLHIQPASPCRDAGDDTAVLPGDTDFDGEARIQGAHVDIGADESVGTVWSAVVPVVRVLPDGDDAADGASWATAKRTIGAAADTLAISGGEVWAAQGYRI